MEEAYVYKKEVDWSLFNYGFAIPLDIQVKFRTVANRFLQRGESEQISLYFHGKSYRAKLNNNNIGEQFGNRADIVQVRYSENSDLAEVLK